MTVPAAHKSAESHSGSGAGAFVAEQPEGPTPAVDASAAPRTIGDDIQSPCVSPTRSGVVPDLSGFSELRIWAESFEDAQRARISCTNRMERGGVPPELFAVQLDALNRAEHEIKLGMVRCYRRVVPADVRAWQKSTFGVGEHLLARLLGALGHPRIATPYHWEGDGENRKLIPDLAFERGVRQLWSYCGHGDAARKRRKGMTAEEAFTLGSPRCKMLVHLLAEATMKCRVEPIPHSNAVLATADPTNSPDAPTSSTEARQNSVRREPSAGQPRSRTKANPGSVDRRYRMVYEQRRALTKELHPDWTDGHSHNDALRIVGKEILRGLWTAAAR